MSMLTGEWWLSEITTKKFPLGGEKSCIHFSALNGERELGRKEYNNQYMITGVAILKNDCIIEVMYFEEPRHGEDPQNIEDILD